jgi:hypothetical protein
MIITKTLTLVAAPEPPFVGTTIRVRIPDDSLTFGIENFVLSDGSESVAIDWGDGSVQEFAADADHITHEYPHGGDFEIRISDGVSSIKLSGSSSQDPDYYEVYAPMVRRVESNGARLTTIQANCFRHCVNLTYAAFPSVSVINGRSGTVPFNECAALTEIHFAATNKDAIEATATYRSDPTLGAPNATVYFDL